MLLSDDSVRQLAVSRKESRRSSKEGGVSWLPVDVEKTEWEEILEGVWFQGSMGLIIVANAVVIGFETDNPQWPGWDIVENLFLFLFAFELTMKMIILGARRFFDRENEEWFWNVFDFFIVSLGLIDFLVSIFEGNGTKSGGGYATVFRMIRLMRILRIFRIVKFLKQLYMLAFGFALAAVAVFWVTFLMMFVLYVCSIILVRTIGDPSPDDPHHDFLHRKFGRLVTAMLTLFEIMSSPMLSDYEEIMLGRPGFCIFLVGFIIFGSFGMIALLTGVISESMFEKNNVRMEEDRMERSAMRKCLIQTCEEWFDQACLKNGQFAKREAVTALLPRVVRLFEQDGTDLQIEDLELIMGVMDWKQSGTIERNEFRHFIVQIAEGVRPLLIMELYYAVGMVKKHSSKIEAGVVSLTEHVEKTEAKKASSSQVVVGLRKLTEQMEKLGGGVARMGERMGKLDERVELVANRVEQVAGEASLLQSQVNRCSQEKEQKASPSPSKAKGSSFWPKMANGAG